MAPAAIPTANPIMKPIFTRSKQLGWVWPYGPTATGIWRGNRDRPQVRDYADCSCFNSGTSDLRAAAGAAQKTRPSPGPGWCQGCKVAHS